MSASGRVLTLQVTIDPHALSLAASHYALTLSGNRSARSATTVVPADQVNAAARPRQPAAVAASVQLEGGAILAFDVCTGCAVCADTAFGAR